MPDLRLPAARDWRHPTLDACAGGGLLIREARLGDVIRHGRGRLCYLATPYSKVAVGADGAWDPSGSLDCAIRAARWARLLALEGVTAVSPVIQAVEMVRADLLERCLDPLDAGFWEHWCRPLLAACGAVIVPPLAGWRESDGI